MKYEIMLYILEIAKRKEKKTIIMNILSTNEKGL